MSDEPGFASLKGQEFFFSERAGLSLYAVVSFVTCTDGFFFFFCILGLQNINSREHIIILSYSTSTGYGGRILCEFEVPLHVSSTCARNM